MSKKKAVVLLSGGLDSATVLAVAKDEGFDACALTFDYGQRHSVELESARRLAADIRHVIVKLDLAAIALSALTGEGEVPKGRQDIADGGVPVTYVPARNLIFLSCAAAWAESLKSRDIFIGVSSVDYSGYPDCREEFLCSFQNTVNLATKAGTEGNKITVHAPFLTDSKADVIRRGLQLGVDYSVTHSCYDPAEGHPCGLCDSCLLREKAFLSAGLADPAKK